MMKEGYGKIAGVSMIVLGVLIWLNAAYSVLDWAKFVAVIAVLWGIKKLSMGCCCEGKKK